jgi:hypothetical protein
MSIPLAHGIFMLCKHTYKYTRKILLGFCITEQVGHGPSHFMESNGMNQMWWEHEGDYCKFSPFREAGIVTKPEATKEASRPSLWNLKKAMKVGRRGGHQNFGLGFEWKLQYFVLGPEDGILAWA